MSGQPVAKRGRKPIDVAIAARKLTLEVDRACLDPTYPVATRALCKRAGVPRSTLDNYKAHPEIAPVLRRIDDLKRARSSRDSSVAGAVAEERARTSNTASSDACTGALRQAGAASARASRGSVPSPGAPIDEIRLAAQYAQSAEQAVWAMQRFVGKHRRAGHVSDLPRTVRDLDLAVRELAGVLNTMRPMAEAWVAHQEGTSGPAQAPPASPEPDQRRFEF